MTQRLSPNQCQPQPVRIGSFNVRWACPDDGEHRWEQRRERSAALLRSWEPDVLGLQEPLRHQIDYLLQALPKYAEVGVERDDGAAAGEFCAILYRRNRFQLLESGTFWLSEEPERPGSMGWGARHARICTWAHLVEQGSEAAFYLYNVHLDHEAQQAREKGVELVLERIRRRSASDPVILTGDFNAWPDNAAVARVQRADSPVSRNALAAANSVDAGAGTFHGFTGHAQENPIDYIFLSSEWRVLEGAVVRGDGARPFVSDHFPVAATLELEV
ncbi:MAG: endonuclease/exonuclease/phosphatase family protein [Armatimonadota bacterium]|nr:endonuclease/exonuclease/phosphatase family protein [Armatimonadota bacterium]